MPDNETTNAMVARQAIAAEVRAEMARQNKSLQDVADMLGLNSRQSVHLRVRGDVPFRGEELVLLAAGLKVPVEQFMPEPTPAGAA